MYFDKPGKENTQQALKWAAERGKELGIDEVVVASTTGFTAYQAIEIFEGFRITVVTYHCGFKEPFQEVSRVRAQVATGLVKRYGIPLAEVARRVGVSTPLLQR
jgi:hypothetical protein